MIDKPKKIEFIITFTIFKKKNFYNYLKKKPHSIKKKDQLLTQFFLSLSIIHFKNNFF
jgi:hypothetical protein